MEYFAGLDVSLETIGICFIKAAGDILQTDLIGPRLEMGAALSISAFSSGAAVSYSVLPCM
jgi:hypothetical protein